MKSKIIPSVRLLGSGHEHQKNNFTNVSKKVFLSLALAMLFVACKEETKDKVEDAAEAVATDVKQSVDTLAAKTEEVIDSTQAKTAKALEKGAEKMGATSEKLKEASKK